MKFNDYNFQIAKHNGVSIDKYNCKDYILFPYPTFKSPIFNEDNLTTANRAFYKSDVDFSAALQMAERRWGNPGQVRDISWRLHILLEHLKAHFTKTDSRIIVELGTGRGYMMTAIAHYFRHEPISGFMYDTFEGILESETSTDENYISKKNFSYASGGASYALNLEDSLNSISSNQVWCACVGTLPAVLEQTIPTRDIAFLHVDLNHAKSELESIFALEGLITSNTLIIFDDTGGPGNEAQYDVHRQISELFGRSLLHLPTGQSIML